MLEDIATGSWGNLSNCMDIVDWTLRSDLYDNFQPVEIWRKIQMEPKQWPNWKGKSYEPNLHDYRFKMSIFQGVLPAGWIDPFKKKIRPVSDPKHPGFAVNIEVAFLWLYANKSTLHATKPGAMSLILHNSSTFTKIFHRGHALFVESWLYWINGWSGSPWSLSLPVNLASLEDPFCGTNTRTWNHDFQLSSIRWASNTMGPQYNWQ